jgi:hypothetical protein
VKRNDALTDHYEELRQRALDRQPREMRWGLAVLSTKGMAAWARSWREQSEGGVQHMPSEPSVSAASSHLPPNGDEVVRVLAAMVWAIQQEAEP